MATSTTAKPVLAKGTTLPQVVQDFRTWAVDIPTGGEDTAQLSILETIAAAGTPTGLDAPWETTGTDTLLGRMLVISALKRMPSDYPTGLGFFLVVSGADADTGEAVTFTTGSVSVVGQLVKAFHEKWLPLKCELVESERPTKSGYKPQHLRVYGKGGDF